jgi:hypothetical protein
MHNSDRAEFFCGPPIILENCSKWKIQVFGKLSWPHPYLDPTPTPGEVSKLSFEKNGKSAFFMHNSDRAEFFCGPPIILN